MSRLTFPIAIAGAALALAAGAADAYTCFLVLDTKDAVVYRDTATPVDLSNRGAAEREALRKSGRYLMIIETDDCAPIGSPNAGPAAVTVADVVGALRPAITSGDAAAFARGSSRGVAAPMPAAPQAAPAAPAAPAGIGVRGGGVSGRY